MNYRNPFAACKIFLNISILTRLTQKQKYGQERKAAILLQKYLNYLHDTLRYISTLSCMEYDISY
jgi:hypothetical protein